METQIASQLGQDLELAVDQDEKHDTEESELPSTYPMTKKRKRNVDESHTEPTKGRRRSSRRASTKEPSSDPQGIRTIRTRRSIITSSIQEPTSNLPPTEPAPKKRKRRSEGNNADQATKTDDAKQTDNSQDADGKSTKDLQPTQRRRKSSRLSGEDTAGGSPIQDKLPRRTRKRGKNKANKAQASLSEATSVETVNQGSSAAEQAGEEQSEPQIQAEAQGQEPEPGTGHLPGFVASQEPQPESDTSDGGVLRSLRGVLDEVKLASLDMDSLKEMDNLLFEIRVQAHEALRRPSG